MGGIGTPSSAAVAIPQQHIVAQKPVEVPTSVVSLSFNKAGNPLAVCCASGSVKIAELSSWNYVLSLSQQDNTTVATAVQWIEDNILCIAKANELHTWQVDETVGITAKLLATCINTNSSANISCIGINPVLPLLLATGAEDGSVCIWNISNFLSTQISPPRECIGNIVHQHKHSDEVTSVSWSPDGSLLLSGSCDQKVKLYERISGRLDSYKLQHQIDDLQKSFRTYMKTSRPVTWHPNSRAFATATKSNNLQIYEIQSRNPGNTLDVTLTSDTFDRSRRNMMCNDYILSLAWSQRNGDILAMSSVRYLRLWRTFSEVGRSSNRLCAELFMIIEKTHGNVQTISWNISNNTLCAGYGDGTVFLWDSVEKESH
jgi:WD40 repeat protein